MPHQATLTYSEPLLRSAVFAFWRRSIGPGFAIAILITTIGLAVLVGQGESSWIVGVLATVLFFTCAFSAALYFVHYRNALHKLRDMGLPRATFLAGESSFTVASGMGTSTLRWSSVGEVWRFADFWLLLFSKAQFITLPLASIPQEMQAFVLQRVQASGGKIVGSPMLHAD